MLDLKREFEFDPVSAQRIADVIEQHPIYLRPSHRFALC